MPLTDGGSEAMTRTFLSLVQPEESAGDEVAHDAYIFPAVELTLQLALVMLDKLE
jgi:hypothetical protein